MLFDIDDIVIKVGNVTFVTIVSMVSYGDVVKVVLVEFKIVAVVIEVVVVEVKLSLFMMLRIISSASGPCVVSELSFKSLGFGKISKNRATPSL